MILTVQGEYQGTGILKMMVIDEDTGTTTLKLIDSTDVEQLQGLHQLLEEGVSFADFHVNKTKDKDTGKYAYELRHLSTNIVPGKPDLTQKEVVIKDEPSLAGLIRKMIREESLLVLPMRGLPEGHLMQWMTANPNTIQFTDHMGMRVSHLIPGSQEGKWRWNSTTLLATNYKDEFTDPTILRFLCSTEMELGEYKEYLIEYPATTVEQENGEILEYKTYGVKDTLPLFTRKTNVLVTPAIISRIKFVADSYKLALYSLTESLFDKKEIEYIKKEYSYGLGNVYGRYVNISNALPVNRKTADEMLDFLFRQLNKEVTPRQEAAMNRAYPHYLVYSSIVKSQIGMFFGGDATSKQKFRAYRSLKNVEAYLNLLLQECKYQMIYDNDAYLFNTWTSTDMFNSDIPYYPVTIEGGGGTWQPNGIYSL